MVDVRLAATATAQTPIVPEGNISSTALVFVIAIMTFLACLTLGRRHGRARHRRILAIADRPRSDHPDQAR